MSTTLSRRKVERKDCLLDARAYVDGQPAVRCSVRNITPQGARLMTESALAARKMLLFLPAIGAVWAAQVRWRRGNNTFGIQFLHGEADLADAGNTSEPDGFALRLQVAQVTETTRRLPTRSTRNPRGRHPLGEA